ncbi:uncharacterized protein LOC141674920 [Apium graveolens]|uniref:uncharacterized protein LOC141674920 n=1 Tax=Apium graveolens TaxID=4045 RepID=UPI003D7AD6BD
MFEDLEQDQGSSKFRGKFGRNVGNQNQKFQKFKPENGNQKNHFQKAGQSTNDNRPQIQECKTCGKRHSGRCNKLNVTCFKCNQKGHYSYECTSGSGKPEMTCFKCGKVGHMARNYKEPIQKANVLRIARPPPPPVQTVQPRARTFYMKKKDVVQDADVVADTLAINSEEVKVLMDSGATRSFISERVIDRLKCVAYLLEYNLIIEIANQERVAANRICPRCDIVIEGCGSLRIEEIPVVKEFPEVFPDELPGLPSDREIKFTIDLAPRTEPVSKAPYRMTPIEMKEYRRKCKNC